MSAVAISIFPCLIPAQIAGHRLTVRNGSVIDHRSGITGRETGLKVKNARVKQREIAIIESLVDPADFHDSRREKTHLGFPFRPPPFDHYVAARIS